MDQPLNANILCIPFIYTFVFLTFLEVTEMEY